MNYTQLRVTVPTEDIERTAAIMSMLDNGILIEDYSDIETGLKTIYGDLIDENILAADKTHGAVSIYIPEDKSFSDYTAFLKSGSPPRKSTRSSSLLALTRRNGRPRGRNTTIR